MTGRTTAWETMLDILQTANKTRNISYFFHCNILIYAVLIIIFNIQPSPYSAKLSSPINKLWLKQDFGLNVQLLSACGILE